jgi:hypothetical protein
MKNLPEQKRFCIVAKNNNLSQRIINMYLDPVL